MIYRGEDEKVQKRIVGRQNCRLSNTRIRNMPRTRSHEKPDNLKL